MERNIFYLYPEVEGQQEFVCWEFPKENLKNDSKEVIKRKVLESLNEISQSTNRWISQRSFSVFLGEDTKNYWVAIPRQLSTKAMKNLNAKLQALDLGVKIVITSYENPFGERYPFLPVISYDRGFIVDSSKIDEKMANLNSDKAVNA